MSLKVKLLLSISLVAVAMGSVRAGNDSEQPDDAAGQYKRNEENDILNHLERGEAVKKTFKSIELKANKTIHYKIKEEQQANPSKGCHANLSFGYLQFDTKARVDTTITNDDCAASSGHYQVILEITDENGRAKSIQHTESWSRSNDAQVESRKFYNIGSNVELMRAKIQNLTCTCTQKTAKDSK